VKNPLTAAAAGAQSGAGGGRPAALMRRPHSGIVIALARDHSSLGNAAPP